MGSHFLLPVVDRHYRVQYRWAKITLFISSGVGRLLLDPDSEEGAGWPHIDPGDLLEELGGGRENHPQRWHCHSLQAMISAEKKCGHITDIHAKKS